MKNLHRDQINYNGTRSIFTEHLSDVWQKAGYDFRNDNEGKRLFARIILLCDMKIF